MSAGHAPREDVVIIGAGPAGLTAAYELVRHGVRPLVLEAGDDVGGLARTAAHRGYRFDLGGHRFYTRVPEIQALWEEVLGPEFLQRPRLSRIFYRGRFFQYPLQPLNVVGNLGPLESALILLSYCRWRLLPHPREDSFEEWVTNRFGQRLFRTFFRSYTEKVWGIPCSELKAEWAAQRIKDLSLWAAVAEMFGRPRRPITSLIQEFHYPRLGPGMMWEAFRRRVEDAGGTVRLRSPVVRIHRVGQRIEAVTVGGEQGEERVPAAAVLTSMPITAFIQRLDPPAPLDVLTPARGLTYRDFLTVCVVVRRADLFPDNWIYVHDPGVRVGRIQNFKNWSPEMVPDPARSSLGLEYFCQEGDEVWNLPDADLVELARRELHRIGLAKAEEIEDGCVVRVPKAYPVYDSAYPEHLARVRAFMQGLENCQTLGRNGLHRYNNQDHSMLTALLAVRNLLHGEQHDLWSVNAEPEYLEERRAPEARAAAPTLQTVPIPHAAE